MAELLERDGELAALRDAVADAAQGRGSVVLVAGQAGIGKSSLMAAWATDPGADARVLTGWCDDFLTSRALAPLHDVARRAGGSLAEAVATGDTGTVCDALLTELAYPLNPTVLVIEDVHWGDDATLDVIRYVGRRIRGLPAVLALTYRDDEVGPDHPLLGVLGSLPPGAVHRVVPHQLSRRAVATLTAGTGLDPDEVMRVTGGNPFFVTELVATGTAVPASVGDAVLARLRKLPAATQRAVEALSVVPGTVPGDLGTVLVGDPASLAAAERRGVLVAEGASVRFRHELARQAVLASLPTTVQIAHHRTALEHLLQTAAEPARILHHAVGARRTDVIASHGPAAANEAYRAGAHRAAVAHHERLLAQPGLLSPDTLAGVLEEHAWSLYNLGRFDDAAAAARRAVTVREGLGERPALVRSLLIRSRMLYMVNRSPEAFTVLDCAEEMLDTVTDTAVRAEVGAHRLSLLHLNDRHEEVLAQWRDVAGLAEPLGRTDLLVYAQVYAGGSMIMLGDDDGFDLIAGAIQAGRANRQLEAAARGYTNLVEFLMLRRRWDEALQMVDEAVRFYDDHDFRAHRYNTLGQRARLHVLQGEWAEGAALLRVVTDSVGVGTGGVLEAIPLEGRALLAVRRGDADAEDVVRDAWEVASCSGSAQYLVPVACAAVEWAWLAGRPEQAQPYVQAAQEAVGATVWLGPLRWRLPLVGLPADAGGVVCEPERTSLAGDWRAASRRWRALGMPVEEALELLRSGEQQPTLEALRLFERLGAEPAARMARRRLRDLGMRTIPRGPAATTRENPLGLTARQVEVLDLLAEGLTNAEIAERLVVSVRTVDHHVSTVLAKLGVASRKEAAELAGLVSG
jgi:DNA-binding CsgD family transcriptional regulator/tetratricopeptide (TPR) repeat protein